MKKGCACTNSCSCWKQVVPASTTSRGSGLINIYKEYGTDILTAVISRKFPDREV